MQRLRAAHRLASEHTASIFSFVRMFGEYPKCNFVIKKATQIFLEIPSFNIRTNNI